MVAASGYHAPHVPSEFAMFLPVQRMMERVEAFGDTDSQRFNELLYAGEFVTKVTTAALVALLENEQQGHRYRFHHSLVRASSLGDWSTTLTDVLTGPASSHFPPSLAPMRRAITQKVSSREWQHGAVSNLHTVLHAVFPSTEPLQRRVSLLDWFRLFVTLRNKTRGHGAPTPATYRTAVPDLQRSINSILEHHPILRLPWAYLHRNLSGKYRVAPLSRDASPFDGLKTRVSAESPLYPDGIYLWADQPRFVPLIHTDPDTRDCFVPNGSFNGTTFELHSPITDERQNGDATLYRADPSTKPPSETAGASELYELGDVLTNIPATVNPEYVQRPTLETELTEALHNDRHPIITLAGRGGIGKTSLSLRVLHDISRSGRFLHMLWFSSRDIDLTETGPKLVQPTVLNQRQIAEHYVRLLRSESGDPPTSVMTRDMHSENVGPTLFVFDNFETVTDPIDVYRWIDSSVRLPNKILITTRLRHAFEADRPIRVQGMLSDEARQLAMRTAERLGIPSVVDDKSFSRLYEETGGHPYIIKIRLGEKASALDSHDVAMPLVRRDDMLEALFDRTYHNLSPLAQRTFLILGTWNSLVCEAVLEATVHGFTEESISPEDAIDELIKMSLIERRKAADGIAFLEVPRIASVFSQQKLKVSPDRELIDSAANYIQKSGPTKVSGLRTGGFPRVEALFTKTAELVATGGMPVHTARAILECIARAIPMAWLLMADWESEFANGSEREIRCLQQFIAKNERADADKVVRVWRRLSDTYLRDHDVVGSCSAFLRAAEVRKPDLYAVSRMANYVNRNIDALGGRADRRMVLLKPLARLCIPHLQDAAATDLSRFAWLHLHCGEDTEARRLTSLGLTRDPGNVYCLRLRDKLNR